MIKTEKEIDKRDYSEAIIRVFPENTVINYHNKKEIIDRIVQYADRIAKDNDSVLINKDITNMEDRLIQISDKNNTVLLHIGLYLYSGYFDYYNSIYHDRFRISDEELKTLLLLRDELLD